MKIGFLTPEFPHPKTGSAGGIGTSLLNLSKGLIEAGHQVSMLVYGQSQDEVFEEGGITFYRIKNIKVKGLSLFLTQHKVKQLINRLYAQQQIDLIEAPDWTGFTAFLKPRCPLVLRLHGSDAYFCQLEQRPVKWWNRFLEKRAFLKADAIISVSTYTGQQTNQVFGTDRDFEVIPNGVDLAQFNPSVRVKNKKILYFGTLIRKKGLLELPLIFNEVHRLHPDAELHLVGKDAGDKISGAASTWALMQLLFDAEALKKVYYHGAVAYSGITSHIASAAICVFPTFAEALPVSWLEAMALEKAVVASHIGWAPEIIEDSKDGLLASPNDHLAFASKISLLLTDTTFQEQLAKAAREKVRQKFSTTVVAGQSAAFYQKILDHNNGLPV